MSFLAPAVLAAAFAAGLPVLIHLLNKARVLKVRWAAMRFLEEAVKKNERRLRIQDILLLALRMLILLFAVLAFARPVLLGPLLPGQGPAGTVILVVDHSLSMAYSDGRETRLDAARRAALDLLNALPTGLSAGLVFASDRAQAVIPTPTKDLALVRRILAMMEQTARGSDLLPALESAVNSLIHSRSERGEIHIFTDDQQAAWQHLAEIGQLVDKHPEIAWVHHPIGGRESANLAITAIQADSEVPAPGIPLQVRVTVQNQGATESEGLRVALSGAERTENETYIDHLSAGESRTVQMKMLFTEPGHHVMTASLLPDQLPLDNSRSLTVHISNPSEIWIMAPPSEEGATPFFLRHALLPIPATAKTTHPVQIRKVGPGITGKMEMQDSPLVVLCGPEAMDSASLQSLRDYVRAGGTLWVFPPRSNAGNGNGGWPLKYSLLQPGSPARLQSSQFNHPVSALWNDAGSGTLESVRFLQRADMKPAGEENAKSVPFRTILSFEDGSPALIEWDEGRGRIVGFAFALDSTWGNIHLHPAFVPLVQRLLAHTSRLGGANPVLEPGDPFVGSAPPHCLGKDFLVQGPSDDSPRAAGIFENQNGGAAIIFRETQQPGAYRIFASDSPKAIAAFAVQPPADAGFPRYTSAQLIEQTLAKSRTEQSVAGAQERAVRFEWWFPLMLIVMCLVVAESVLAHRLSCSR